MAPFAQFPREAIYFRSTSIRPFRYSDLLVEQARISERVRAGGAGATLLAEVEPVITYGRTTRPEEFLRARAEEVRARGIELLPVSRGGRATYHGPGQWIVFVVESLERLTGDSKGVRRATDILLERALIAVRSRVPHAEIRPVPEIGIWNSAGDGDAASDINRASKKYASLGLSIENRVLGHGLAFNAFSTSESFFGIDPCGIAGARPGYALEHAPPGSNEREFIAFGTELRQAFSLDNSGV